MIHSPIILREKTPARAGEVFELSSALLEYRGVTQYKICDIVV
jgi:hypothetical protein